MSNTDLIDKYFSDSLSPKEQMEFNERLQNNENFKKEFVFQKDLKKTIVSQQHKNLKKVLQSFEQERSKVRLLNISRKWWVAASILVIFSIGFLLLRPTLYPSPEELFAENFEPYRNIVLPVERSSNSNSIKQSAFLAYENGNYHKAINLFNSIQDRNLIYVDFYKSMCYLSLNKNVEAIDLLIPITVTTEKGDTDKNFNELANWYLALAYLKVDEKEKAISRFSSIANDTNDVYKKEESKRILKHLK